jgi:hypothetical protein
MERMAMGVEILQNDLPKPLAAGNFAYTVAFPFFSGW